MTEVVLRPPSALLLGCDTKGTEMCLDEIIITVLAIQLLFRPLDFQVTTEQLLQTGAFQR